MHFAVFKLLVIIVSIMLLFCFVMYGIYTFLILNVKHSDWQFPSDDINSQDSCRLVQQYKTKVLSSFFYKLSSVEVFIIGAVAKVVATTVTYPLQTIQSILRVGFIHILVYSTSSFLL